MGELGRRPGPLIDRLAEACREHGVHCAIGVNERESERPGSLYNTLLLLGPGRRCSQAPQADADDQERLFHGIGAGDDLDVTETPLGGSAG